MSETMKVKVLRGFLDGSTHVDSPDVITVGRERAMELARNGLVELPAGETVPTREGVRRVEMVEQSGAKEEAVEQKQAQEPKNKKSAEPKNKAR